MAIYKYRCPDHGDFTLEQPMATTTMSARCSFCTQTAPKVLCSNLHFTYGRHEFKDGVDGTGETVRETAERWTAQHRDEGREPVHMSSKASF